MGVRGSERATMIYDFEAQFQKQKEIYEAFVHWLLDRSTVQFVRQASREEDLHQGIDLWVFKPEKRKMQVKVDFIGHRTGNMAYEIVSQAYTGPGEAKIGWGLKLSEVDYLTYILAETSLIMIYSAPDLQEEVLKNYRQYRNFAAANKDYLTLGILVPLRAFADHPRVILEEADLLDLNAGELGG